MKMVVGGLFHENLVFSIGMGIVACLWEDPWVEGLVVLR